MLDLQMHALQSFQMSQTTCFANKCHIQEDLNLQQDCCENLKSHTGITIFFDR
jgi:hypothetical protein